MTMPTAEEARDLLRPDPALEQRIRTFLSDQLGRVLPSDPARGLAWYYEWVVLGERAREAWRYLDGAWVDRSLPLVDIGCGTGSLTLLANEVGGPAVGIEPGDEVELAVARWQACRGTAPAPFLRAVGETLPFADASVGAVMLHDVLEHVRDWEAVLREVRRVLAPGAGVYVKGPSYAFRFVEPHYRVPWAPLLPKPIARRYLSLLGRDTDYLEHIGYRRRGAVLSRLLALGFELSFPRRQKLEDLGSINRASVRRVVAPFAGDGPLAGIGRALADQPLQSVIDVVARRP